MKKEPSTIQMIIFYVKAIIELLTTLMDLFLHGRKHAKAY